jgi:hypothetical protein
MQFGHHHQKQWSWRVSFSGDWGLSRSSLFNSLQVAREMSAYQLIAEAIHNGTRSISVHRDDAALLLKVLLDKGASTFQVKPGLGTGLIVEFGELPGPPIYKRQSPPPQTRQIDVPRSMISPPHPRSQEIEAPPRPPQKKPPQEHQIDESNPRGCLPRSLISPPHPQSQDIEAIRRPSSSQPPRAEARLDALFPGGVLMQRFIDNEGIEWSSPVTLPRVARGLY